MSKFKLKSTTIIAGAMLIASPLMASADDVSQKSDEIQEITVTAQKRAQSIQDVPVSVSAISGDDMVIKGIDDITKLSYETPSLKVVPNVTPIASAFRIRGIGSFGNIPNFEPEVGLFVDGVFIPKSGLGVGDLVEIERIEVIDGPQSALYGKNVNAGVISVITKAPPKQFEGMAETTVSEFDGAQMAPAEKLKLAVGGPVDDKVQLSLSGVYYNQAGYERNVLIDQDDGGQHRYAMRAQAAIQATDDLKFRIILDHSQMNDQYDPSFFQGTEPALLNAKFKAPCPVNNPNAYSYCLTENTNERLSSTSLGILGDLDLGWATLSSASGFINWDSVEDSPGILQVDVPLFDFHDHQYGTTLNQEFRLTSAAPGPLQWLAGAYYYYNDQHRGDGNSTPMFSVEGPDAALIPIAATPRGVIVAGQPGYAGYLNSHTVTNYEAGFGQVSYSILPQWTTTGSLRLQSETKRMGVVDSDNETAPSLLTLSLTPPAASAFLHRTDNFVSGSLNTQYRFSDEAMLYATYSRGGKSGGFNSDFGPAPVTGRAFKEETVDSYEAGSKLDLLNRHLRINAAGFVSIFHDYQEASYVTQHFLVNNAEQVSDKGFEAQANYILGGGFSANVAGSYTLARYDSYLSGACFPGEKPSNAALGTCDLSGKQLPLAPKEQGSIGVSYYGSTKIGDFYSRAEYVWPGGYEADNNYDPRAYQKAFGMVNLRAGMVWDTIDLSVFANNALNKTYILFSGAGNLSGSDPAYQNILGLPGEYGVTARITF